MQPHPVFLVLRQIYPELLRGGVDRTVLDDGLDPLRAQSQADLTTQVIREESLPLQVHLLNLVDVLVRESDDAGLSVGRLPEEVARPFPHDEGGARRRRGCGGGGAVENEGSACEGGGRGNDQGQEEGGDGGSHGGCYSVSIRGSVDRWEVKNIGCVSGQKDRRSSVRL